MQKIKSTTMYYKGKGSDKVYVATMYQGDGGYSVIGANGARGSTLTPRPQNDTPVDLAQAEKLFDKLVRSKVNHRDTPYVIGPDLNESYEPPANTTPDSTIQPLLLTAIEDADAAAQVVLNDDYAVQEKLDGIRIAIIAEPSGITAYNRSGKARGIADNILNEARRLQKRLSSFALDGECIGADFHAFDMLGLDGEDLRPRDFVTRHHTLVGLLSALSDVKVRSIHLVPTAFVAKQKAEMVQALFARGAEGAVLRNKLAPYVPGRQPDQYKYKFVQTASCLVTKKNAKDSVAIGLFDTGGQLIDVGNVKIRNSRTVVKEGDVVEVRYLNCLPGGHLYQPFMVAVRDDIDAGACVLAQVHYKGQPRA